MATTLTQIFLATLLAIVLMRMWLARRHIAHVMAHRGRVPEAFSATISLQAHQKAADYTAAKAHLATAQVVSHAVVLGLFTLGGILQWLDERWLAGIPDMDVLRGALVIFSALTLTALADLPFDYYKTFVLDERFGFNKMTPRMFAIDLFKHTLVGLVLGAPLLFAALWLMLEAGSAWWFFLWLILSGFNVAMLTIYPTFIAPLFNTFTPLADASLKSRIEALLAKCGFKSNGLFVMDGSTRSTHGNAYFTGFGASKRVVFFDTLLGNLAPEEIEAVLAHELGHFRHRHVFKRIVLLFAASLAGLALLGWLAGQDWFYAGLGVATPSNHMALLLFILVSPPFTFLLRPLFAAYARKNEFEADAYAAQHANAGHLVSALAKLYRDNASTLTPDPLHSSFYDSHPPAGIRIARLQGNS